MDAIIDFWIKLCNYIFWGFWSGSIIFTGASISFGLLIGCVAWIIWFVILQVLWYIEYKKFIWEK